MSPYTSLIAEATGTPFASTTMFPSGSLFATLPSKSESGWPSLATNDIVLNPPKLT